MMAIRMFFASLAIISALAVAQARAERAASIEFGFVERPGNLPTDFQASADVALRFLTIKAIDGFQVDAALWQPRNKAVGATTLIVGVHGNGGNYAGPPIGSVSPLLSRKGYGVLTISTRQHDELHNTENFFEVRRDIEAAVFTARALGYQTLVLWGHSLGNIHVQFYAANTWDRDIKAIVLSAMFHNLPWMTRYILMQDEDAFHRLSEAAMKSLREGKERELLPLRMRRTLGIEEPISGLHFLTYRSEASSAADGTYWIKRIPRPILMVRDSRDAIIPPFQPYALLGAATSPGSLVPSIDYALLPNPKGDNPPLFEMRDHMFIDSKEPLVQAITRWLADKQL